MRPATATPRREPVKLRLATRGSQLALWQAQHVVSSLKAIDPDIEVELTIVRTTGDQAAAVPLARIGAIGIFTREIDQAVMDGSADAAVHSLKDLPTDYTAELWVAAVLRREDPRDAYLPAPGRPRSLDALPAGSTVGTSSLRRRALLMACRPDLNVQDLRGNLDSRLGKVQNGVVDAAVLALAGVRRLGREDAVGETLELPEWLPAAGQGAIAVVTRSEDAHLRALMSKLDDADTRIEVTAERSLLNCLHGGCQIPIGALAVRAGREVTLFGFVGQTDGTRILRADRTGSADEAIALGEALARELEQRGAREIIAEARRFQSAAVSAP